ncbi:MAG: hypothetical protein ACYCS8_05330 [Acidithiobacillus sp.]
MTLHRKAVAMPFVATFTMGSPTVLSRFGLPRMESLLRHRQVVTGGNADDELPLALHHCGTPAAGGLFPLSRQAPYNAESVTKGESIFQCLVNLGFSGQAADNTVRRGHPRMKANGKVVSSLQTWTILPARTLVARGVGDPRATLQLLERDPFIGVGTNLGYGEVLHFQVEEADWDDQKDGDDPLMSPWVFLDKQKRLTTPLPDTKICAEMIAASQGMVTRGSASFHYPFRTGAAQSAFLPVNG